MEKKICSKCKIEKDVCKFHKWKYSPDGYKNICKECRKQETKSYYENNNEKIKTNVSKYRAENIKKVESLRKKIYERDKEKILSVNKNYRDKNKDKIKEYKKQYLENNKEEIKKKKKEYYINNVEYYNKKNKFYRENNKEKRNEYQKNRKLTDPIFKLNYSIRARINSFIKNKKIKKNNKTFEIVGCTPIELKEHLEKKFTEGMSWGNHGFYGWHIDHIIPLSSAKTEEELYNLFHFTNLQPLWGLDNMKKGAKIIPQ
jgi:hypothetical protein